MRREPTHTLNPKYWKRDLDQWSSLLEPSETWIQVRQGIESTLWHTLASGHSQVCPQIEDDLSQQSFDDYWRFSIL